MIELFLTLIFVSAISASFSYLLDFCFQEGNIFEFWGNFLAKHAESWWSKPLGGCIVCSGVWQALIICPILLHHYGLQILPFNLIICILFSNLIIRKLI